MKTIFFTLLICLIATASCSNDRSVAIEGKVSSDAFEGSKAYIIANEGAIQRYEDSAVIRNGRFAFNLRADSMDLRTLTIPMKGNAAVQDLIFIKESGKLDVVMATKSYSTGARLNKIIMEWKRNNYNYDSTQYDLYYRANIPGISKSAYDSLVKLSDLTDSVYLSWVRETLDNNTGNAIGLLFFDMYYDQLLPEQKKRILEKNGEEYFKRNFHIWSRVMFDEDIPKENGSIK